MFKEKFIDLCNEKGVSPSRVCREIGLAPATFSCWTNESIPRETTLRKLAAYFNVPVDYFLNGTAKDTSSDQPAQGITAKDQTELLEELRRRPSMQVLFSLAKNASDEDIERAIKIIMALKQ